MHDEPAFVALGFKSNRRGGMVVPSTQQPIHNSDCAVRGGKNDGAGVLALLALVI